MLPIFETKEQYWEIKIKHQEQQQNKNNKQRGSKIYINVQFYGDFTKKWSKRLTRTTKYNIHNVQHKQNQKHKIESNTTPRLLMLGDGMMVASPMVIEILVSWWRKCLGAVFLWLSFNLLPWLHCILTLMSLMQEIQDGSWARVLSTSKNTYNCVSSGW